MFNVRYSEARHRARPYATGNAGEVEWLDAPPVARQHELPPPRIPQCDREHAVELMQEVEAVILVEMDEHLGVRGARRAAALLGAPRNCRFRR